MNEGDVVLCDVPQSDGTIKNRPAVFLRVLPPFRDLLVCGISTQLRQEVKNFDDVISVNDSDFGSSGLIRDSLIRLGYLAVLPHSQVVGVIGSISKERHQRLLERLSSYLIK